VTMNQARFGLLGIFAVCLLAQLIAFFAVGSKMWPEDLQALIFKIVAVYSVHLTVILGGIFAQPKGPLEDPPAPLAWTAITLAVLWNVLLAWRSFAFSMASQDSAPELIKYLDGVGSSTSFLVTGALAFFFTKGTDTAKPPARSSPATEINSVGPE
jgi:hypothetical protein